MKKNPIHPVVVLLIALPIAGGITFGIFKLIKLMKPKSFSLTSGAASTAGKKLSLTEMAETGAKILQLFKEKKISADELAFRQKNPTAGETELAWRRINNNWTVGAYQLPKRTGRSGAGQF